MELRHLNVFIALAEELHFGRAASRLHVAQSAISQTLRDLEDELGSRLFERNSRQVRLSDAGHTFRLYAQEAVQLVERGVRATRTHSLGGRLRIRLLPASMTKQLPTALAQFATANPNTLLEIQDGASSKNLEALQTSLCDVALVSLASSKQLGPSFAHLTLEAGPLCIMVPPRHRLAKHTVVQWEELKNERMLSLQRDDEPNVRRHLDAKLANVGAILTAIERSHPRALLPMIAAGLGIAVLPAFVTNDKDGVRSIPLAGPGRGGVIAVWNRQPTAPTRRFVELLQNVSALES